MKKFTWSYDDEFDILYVRDEGRSIKHTIGLDHSTFIVDFDANDRVAGVEILSVSDVIYGLSKKMLKSIKAASFAVSYKKNLITIGIAIKSKIGMPIQTSIAVPKAA